MFAITTRFASKIRNTVSNGLLRRALARAIAAMMVAAVIATVMAGSVGAQQYKSHEPKMNIRQAKTLAQDVANAMRNLAAFQGGGEAAIDRYFGDFFFRQMTLHKPSQLLHLSKYRETLFKRFLRPSPVVEAQQHLTNIALRTAKAISRRNYHPAVRYNATLIIGMLDQKYSVGGAPPVVLPAGTKDLLELLEQDKFNDVKVHPSVKVGALEGLERHVRFGIDAQDGERVTKAALAVLAQEPSVLDVDLGVNNWIKCQAARVLARQFKEGPSNEVQAALTKLIADGEMELEDRCCIVALLEKMKYTAGAGPDVAAAVVPLGRLTIEVVAEGAEKAREFEQLIVGGPGGGRRRNFGRRGRGDEGPKLERRQLLARLKSIEKGAGSLSNGLSDEEKQKVQALTDLLAPVMKRSEDKKSLDLDVAGDVIKLEDTINNMVASWQPAAAPTAVEAAAAADADFAE